MEVAMDEDSRLFEKDGHYGSHDFVVLVLREIRQAPFPKNLQFHSNPVFIVIGEGVGFLAQSSLELEDFSEGAIVEDVPIGFRQGFLIMKVTEIGQHEEALFQILGEDSRNPNARMQEQFGYADERFARLLVGRGVHDHEGIAFACQSEVSPKAGVLGRNGQFTFAKARQIGQPSLERHFPRVLHFLHAKHGIAGSKAFVNEERPTFRLLQSGDLFKKRRHLRSPFMLSVENLNRFLRSYGFSCYHEKIYLISIYHTLLGGFRLR